ncbi:flagellar basal-body MS-ring/collar protein FliF [Dyella sp. ASV21]|uniref:flagellar basal-body MS-ring/collar protein FliF n=1 Tax=Dyella sp. ASV21 TaxID=2795114 RepID=UPI0018ED101E|nr:flagellar basal-body MS-ring/collar protein FliF [Dyella sp. ASV21]
MADNALATTDEKSGSRLDLKQLARTPATRQLLLLIGVAAAVALGVAVVLWSRGPNYGLLYAGLEQKDAAAVTQALQTANVPYTLGADGTSIMVPASDLAAVRLKLAAQGLPQGSVSTTTAAGGDSPFGMSDLAERTRYQQMLETDLGNTISGLQSVRAARVHLALPKPSAFIRDNREASASVLVTLYPGRQLDASQVAAIVHLVASSVPSLDPKQVSVVDQQGQLLTNADPASASSVGDARLRLATRIENTYAQRIEELLTPLVGPGKVRAQVYADLDFSETEKATETYGHEHPALRSEQTSSEQRVGESSDGAVPGALSNQPPNTVAQPTAARPAAGKAPGKGATTAQAAPPGETTSSATRNYELDRTVSHVSDPAGRLARLTVAVVVDNKSVAGDKGGSKSVPFTPQELEHLTTLTRNAVGFSETRGDNVSVINQPFHQDATGDVTPTSVPFWERPGMIDLIKQAAGILVALLVAFGLLRPLLRGLARSPLPGQELALAGAGMAAPTMSVRIDDKDDVQDDVARISTVTPAMAYEQRISMARRMVNDNPKQVAQVVKSWVGEDGG